MRDLQLRLAQQGFSDDLDDPGHFGPRTEAAVAAFQTHRGLRADGICGPQMWAELVEAGYRPGDRLLYYTSPPLRGDDVAALQRCLGTLGFDAGRVDGIFGEQTQQALLEFQRNAGVATDAVAGPATLDVVARLSSRTKPEPVARVREREILRRSPPTLAGRRLVVGDLGGVAALVQAVTSALAPSGALVFALQHPDPSAQSAHANGLDADVYLGLGTAGRGCSTAYYAGHGFESSGGRQLAGRIQEDVPQVLGLSACQPVGMAVPVLRETRMPAVMCELGPPEAVVERGAAVAAAFALALQRWAEGLDDL